MNLTALILTAALAAMPPVEQATESPPIDFAAAITRAAADVVAKDHGLQVVQRSASTPSELEEAEGTSYFGMLYGNSYDPAVMAFMAASMAEIYSASDLRTQCGESEIVTCSDPFPSTVQEDALVTAGMYAAVTGLQRLAKTQWGVDLDDGWKNVMIWGGVAAVRGFITAQNMSDANALRDLGR